MPSLPEVQALFLQVPYDHPCGEKNATRDCSCLLVLTAVGCTPPITGGTNTAGRIGTSKGGKRRGTSLPPHDIQPHSSQVRGPAFGQSINQAVYSISYPARDPVSGGQGRPKSHPRRPLKVLQRGYQTDKPSIVDSCYPYRGLKPILIKDIPGKQRSLTNTMKLQGAHVAPTKMRPDRRVAS